MPGLECSGAFPSWAFLLGLQCFKIAGLTFFPLGRKSSTAAERILAFKCLLDYLIRSAPGAGTSALLQILCVTIVGIPFGLQQFKLAKLALMFFGAAVV